MKMDAEKPEIQLNTKIYKRLKSELVKAGFGGEITWARDLGPCRHAFDFWTEYSWVVVNSGIKNQVARSIWIRILDAIIDGRAVFEVFRHKGKAKAIEEMWENKEKIFREYKKAKDKISYLETLPWIGKITKFHLAKNLGLPVCKPDRHLVRIAAKYFLTPNAMCNRLSRKTGDSITIVDTVIWRAGNLGMI